MCLRSQGPGSCSSLFMLWRIQGAARNRARGTPNKGHNGIAWSAEEQHTRTWRTQLARARLALHKPRCLVSMSMQPVCRNPRGVCSEQQRSRRLGRCCRNIMKPQRASTSSGSFPVVSRENRSKRALSRRGREDRTRTKRGGAIRGQKNQSGT